MPPKGSQDPTTSKNPLGKIYLHMKANTLKLQQCQTFMRLYHDYIIKKRKKT